MSAQPQPDNTNRNVVKAPNARMLETLDRMKAQISAALPRHIKPEYLIRVVVTTCNKNPQLYDAFQQNPASFLGAIMECSQLGLVPDGVLGMAYLIPYKNNRNGGKLDTQVQIGYKGLMDLAYRSGKVHFITAQTVRAGDEFEFDLAQMTIKHKPAAGERGEAIYYYAVARVEGVPFPIFAVMSKSDAEQHRAKFAARKGDSAPWWSHFDAMAEKTCVRELCKWLPRATELDGGRIQRAAALDELAEASIPQEFITIEGVVVDENDGAEQKAPEPATTPRRGSAALKEELARKGSSLPPETAPSASAPPPPNGDSSGTDNADLFGNV